MDNIVFCFEELGEHDHERVDVPEHCRRVEPVYGYSIDNLIKRTSRLCVSSKYVNVVTLTNKVPCEIIAVSFGSPELLTKKGSNVKYSQLVKAPHLVSKIHHSYSYCEKEKQQERLINQSIAISRL